MCCCAGLDARAAAIVMRTVGFQVIVLHRCTINLSTAASSCLAAAGMCRRQLVAWYTLHPPCAEAREQQRQLVFAATLTLFHVTLDVDAVRLAGQVR